MTDWTETEKHLTRTFEFSGFKQAVTFVNHVAQLAEKVNHHPDIFIFDYKKVKLTLSTHSANRVTEKDHELAHQIEALVHRHSP